MKPGAVTNNQFFAILGAGTLVFVGFIIGVVVFVILNIDKELDYNNATNATAKSSLPPLTDVEAGAHPLVAAPPLSPTQERGKQVYANCVACHGDNGQGNKTTNAPRLAGQEEWYVKDQLEKFRNGKRGTHKADAFGAQMPPFANMVTGDSVNDLTSYLKTLDGVAETQATGSAEAGKALFAAKGCIQCHGANGEGNTAMHGPKLAGQNAWYVVTQLKNFKAGARGYDPTDAYGAMMKAMAAAQLAAVDDKGLDDIAAWLQSLEQ